ncbi:MAG: hypothetical protein JW993_15245 [Sedimentisphaerales bacterium]|nr:hypothetical protein [Sedimentisphaerales bacterium]
MGTEKWGLGVLVSLLVVAGLVAPVSAAYDIEDLSGTWSIHGLVSGADPNVAGCFYMTGTADTAGGATATSYADSQGVTAATWAENSATFALSGGGILSIDSNDVPFHGAVSWDEDLVVSGGTLIPGPDTGLTGYNLWVWVPQTTTPTFTAADGAGTWWIHGLYVSNDWGSWSHGQLQIDAAGNFSFVAGTWALSDDPDANEPEDGSFTITPFGVIGLSFDPNVHGILNLDKDLIVFTMPEENGGGLNIMQKRSGGVTFSTADLAGTWNLHEIFAGADADWTGWSYGVVEADNTGAVDVSYVGNDEAGTASDTLAITSGGIVTVASDPNSHGTMSDDKNLIVVTMDNGPGGAELLILTRAIVSPVHRFWSSVYACHFYTISEAVKNYVLATWPDAWEYETEAYYAFPENSVPDLSPIYRFWSETYAAHFYTISEDDKNYVMNTWPDTWAYEGAVAYAYAPGDQPPDASPVYRFWSETLACHFYTISEADKNYVLATWPDVWEYEEIAWYAYD